MLNADISVIFLALVNCSNSDSISKVGEPTNEASFVYLGGYFILNFTKMRFLVLFQNYS